MRFAATLYPRGYAPACPFEWTRWLAAAVHSSPFRAWRLEVQARRGANPRAAWDAARSAVN